MLESDHEDGLSSFEEPKEEIGDFEGNSDIKEFFFFHSIYSLLFQILLTEECLLIMRILNLKMTR